MKKTSEVYEKLYHYSTWDGLCGILKTQSLWATHNKFLNDYSEIILFRPKLIEFLLPHVREIYTDVLKESPEKEQRIDAHGGLDAVVRDETEKFVDRLYNVTGHEIYISSFCGEHKNEYIDHNGLLSQWRGYGRDGGFALVFNTQKLENILQLEAEKFDIWHFILADIIYSDDDEKYQDELSKPLHEIANYMKEIFDAIKNGKGQAPDSKNAFPAFVNCISRWKHRGFKEENEVRIVAMPAVQEQEYRNLTEKTGHNLKPDKERKFREKNKEYVPYIALFNAPNITLPIERIIVGPHKEKEARASALRVMLKDTNINVSVADIPYVE